jgi:hypothetical protein
MAQRRAAAFRHASVPSFDRSAQDDSEASLDIAGQLAEVFRSIDGNARETEAHAAAADAKLREASKALAQAQSHITATEDRLRELEERALLAEAEACEAKQALAAVEEALGRLLRARSGTASSSSI